MCLIVLVKKNYLYFVIFLISVAYAFFMTEKIPFFWEDVNYFDEGFWQNTTYYGREKTYSRFYDDVFKTIFDRNGFYSIAYSGLNERPLTSFFWRYAELFLGKDLFAYRFIKALFFGILVLVILLISMRFLNIGNSALLVISYASMPQLWYAIFANADEAIVMHTLTLSALFIYFYKYQYENNSFKLLFYGLVIFILTRLSILFKHEGRILYVGIFLYILIKNYKELFSFKNYFLILVLAFISFPILGLFENGVVEMDFHKAKLGADNAAKWSDFFFDLKIPLMIVGHLFILFMTSLLFLLLKRNLLDEKDKHLLVFLIVFLILELGIVFFAHGFNITVQDFGRVTFIFFTANYLLLVFLTLDRAKSLLIGNKVRKIFIFLFYVGIFYLIIHNFYLVNQLRGAWGDYVIGFNNLAEYVDLNYNNSFIFVESVLTTTPIALSRNYFGSYNLVGNKFQVDAAVNAKLKNYEHIFFASRSELNISDTKIVLVLKRKADDTSIYGNIKKMLGRSSGQDFYLYDLTKMKNEKNNRKQVQILK